MIWSWAQPAHRAR